MYSLITHTAKKIQYERSDFEGLSTATHAFSGCEYSNQLNSTEHEENENNTKIKWSTQMLVRSVHFSSLKAYWDNTNNMLKLHSSSW